ncbi:tyrosinase family protein [uncultured Psychroserpens sp.]|uniref:tyrosinase family protein n=1 Tax=uncultured Psychroserpens sp. TaxID=255436 RepID=UPI0026312701|nr:tyrosinase family protein [uncultured Psychroserpens sp.]
MSNSTAAPTWYGGIRDMFTQTDIDHMSPHGILLNDYDSVKSNAPGIYGQLAAGNMPPKHPWPKSQVQTFLDWMTNNYPKGTPSKESSRLKMMATASATRVRKDVSSLSSGEIATLKKAFSGVMKLKTNDPNGYFIQAGYHGLPNAYCMHHIPGYNPWHRAYLYSFENALRTIPGCEDVTLPYWDLFNDFPDILNQEPFANYTLPEDLNSNYKKGYVTQRNSVKTMESLFKQYDVLTDFTRAKTQQDWEDYHGGQAFGGAPNDTSISAHDGGHVATGPTMADQNVAAFDPIFWFYHCNIDRMFWEWQKSMHATDINGLLSTITTTESRNIFTIPVLESLPPFTNNTPHLNTVKIVDSIANLDVDYDPPAKETKEIAMAAFTTKRRGSVAASEKFHVDTDIANVRVKGINRIKIPGSFSVHLLKDGEKIASKAFFQPSEVDKCPNCVENPIVHVDFKLPLKEVKSGKLETWIEPLNHAPFGDRFPHKMMDNPTINVRLLLRNE